MLYNYTNFPAELEANLDFKWRFTAAIDLYNITVFGYPNERTVDYYNLATFDYDN